MEVSLSVLSLQLPRGGTMRLRSARGVVMRVRCGRLWLTEQGLPDDVILGPGDSWRLRVDGRVVVEADSASQLELVGQPRQWRFGPRKRAGPLAGTLRDALARLRPQRGWMPAPRPSALLP